MKTRLTLRRLFVVAAVVLGCTLVILSLVTVVAANGGVPTVDGRFTGDEANYKVLGSAAGNRGTLYFNRTGDTLYLAVVVSTTVNDNVFGKIKGDAPLDIAYVQSAGWSGSGNQHQAKHLINSDNVELKLQCGNDTYEWIQGYLYDADGDQDPHEADWLSDPLDGSGGGAYWPTVLISSTSSLQWNLNNAATNNTWDVTLGGNRSGSEDWKSPDDVEWEPSDNDVTNNGYPTYDSVHDWEWALVYEMSIDVSACGSNIIVSVPRAHNSPPKDGTDDVPICPDGCPLLGSIGDYVWIDEPSANGIQDGQDGIEFGLDGIRVYLYEDDNGNGVIDPEDDLLNTVTTANGGKYLFENLPAGNYIVKVDDTDVGNEGLSPVARYQGGDTAKDSNGSTSTPYTSESVSLAAGEDNLTIDFGYYSPPTAVTLSSFAAKSNAGGSASWLWLGLAGLTVLTAGSLFWAKRRAG